ncbi:MAG TPA: hypothetical protein VJX31_05950, partial [Casimicrobiaceae bacterium]|nr:hypothetical protein [Casimicrobiaceae bacterium]
MKRAVSRAVALLLIVTCCLAPLGLAAAQEVVGVDLKPLIEEAAKHRNRFAVNVPHRFSTTTHGEWTTREGTRDWTYSVRIPTAVSMSFYAVPVRLPESAQVTVTGVDASATYRASDIARGSIWG